MCYNTGNRNFPLCVKICYEYSYRAVKHHVGEDIYFLFGAVKYCNNDGGCFLFGA